MNIAIGGAGVWLKSIVKYVLCKTFGHDWRFFILFSFNRPNIYSPQLLKKRQWFHWIAQA